MDRNPFKSVNDRRSKIVADRGNVTLFQQGQGQGQALQGSALRSSIQQQLAPSSPSRSLASSNWRSHAVDEMASPARGGGSGSSGNVYSPFGSPAGGQQQQPLQPGSAIRGASSSYATHGMEQYHSQHQASALVTAPYSNLGAFSDMQLDASYAYCYDRGNGQYTRLIPADMLPALKEIPALQQGCAGMVVVPLPRALPPNGRSSNTEMVFPRSPPPTPTSPSDTIQSRIDTIVGSVPSTPTRATLTLTSASAGPSTALVLARSSPPPPPPPPPPSSSSPAVHTQAQAHGHHHGRPTQVHAPPARRPKVYCDKWVHEGVCAFTQQGCKFKHEMPLDRATQHQLGLFHGLPAWWKKHQAELARQREPLPLPLPAVPFEPGLTAEDRFLGHGGTPAVAARGAGGELGVIPGPAAAMGPPPAPQNLAWRRGVAAPESPHDQKPLSDNRFMSRGVSVRNPIASFGSSPFGPIGPPPRISTGTAAPGPPTLPAPTPVSPSTTTAGASTLAAGASPRASGSDGREAKTPPPPPPLREKTSASSSATKSNPPTAAADAAAAAGGGRGAGAGAARNAGAVPTANPFASLVALDESDGSAAGADADDERAPAPASSGARLS
ncbi:hypothetical protein GGS23DRAFT_614750 [Durotheca rogersii]|uniref:uncharacterized protein n=1 Tax=Durotheca rogersii TaxID=419775 RepID=UPI0022210702|nr:uncharacterized protein GGS23DRAFT_614750 [Durotheca rogersii]KAI5859733.1 hypothetical protein GGS23DRAFT_614750 [Durotheca rogersii]